jgi:hypothetical protein
MTNPKPKNFINSVKITTINVAANLYGITVLLVWQKKKSSH